MAQTVFSPVMWIGGSTPSRDNFGHDAYDDGSELPQFSLDTSLGNIQTVGFTFDTIWSQLYRAKLFHLAVLAHSKEYPGDYPANPAVDKTFSLGFDFATCSRVSWNEEDGTEFIDIPDERSLVLSQIYNYNGFSPDSDISNWPNVSNLSSSGTGFINALFNFGTMTLVSSGTPKFYPPLSASIITGSGDYAIATSAHPSGDFTEAVAGNGLKFFTGTSSPFYRKPPPTTDAELQGITVLVDAEMVITRLKYWMYSTAGGDPVYDEDTGEEIDTVIPTGTELITVYQGIEGVVNSLNVITDGAPWS